MPNIDYTQYVNTNIGTIGHLLQSTAPNVQSPHGAAVIAPVFRPGMKDRYLSDRIFGFQAGATVVMPTVSGSEPDFQATASVFDHDFEVAAPDYYEVLLEDGDILARHTACENYGMFHFTFPDPEKAWVAFYTPFCSLSRWENGRLTLLSGADGGRFALLGAMFDLPGAAEVTFFDTTVPNGSKPHVAEPARAVLVRFTEKEVYIPFLLSSVGADTFDGAYDAHVKGKTFEQIRRQCADAWNAVLGKVRLEGATPERLKVFYTAVYRACSRLHNYSVEGKYLGFDGKVHDDGGFGYHCDDGIWDTYRGMHPLQQLLEPRVHREIIESYLRMYRDSGWLPRFPYLAGNIPCMLGHHFVSVLAGSMARGVEFDYELAYEAAYKNATRRTMLPWRDGEAEELTRCYYEKGFFPGLEEDEEETCDKVHEFENRQSVAVTIEHSYDDWCVAQLAKKLGRDEDMRYFLARSENYKKLYDSAIGFFHPRKMDGSFTEKYDPKWCGGQGGRMYYAENNAYIYNFGAQHDVEGMMELHGGREAFAAKLDNLYVEQYDGWLKSTFLMQYPDATGLMGQFCMGNEPSFHIPYLYNFCGQAYKTQRKLHEIMDLWFTDSPLGICGDEDGGAMSAFLAFSAMGFYPVNPAGEYYDLGSPIFDRVELDLPNGKTFTVSAPGAAGKDKYIQKAVLNGVELTEPRFTYAEMMKGGTLELTMGPRPNKQLFA